MDGLRRIWTTFRGWPLRAQIVTGVIAFFILVAPFTAEDESTDIASRDTTTQSTTTTAPTTTTTTLPPGVPAVGDDTTVSSITDGDTFRVANGDAVRLIGVDTPETDTCFAAEATAHLNSLIPPGTRIRLAYDVERLDRFQRTLAYVYRLTDGLFVNAAMARDGFAMQLTVPPNVAKADEFRAAVAEARTARRGLWAACQATTTARPTTTRAPVATRPPATAPPAAVGNCSAAYPDVCIPPPPPDLDCGEISHRRFRVLPLDPHGFDGNDNDGLGCESG